MRTLQEQLRDKGLSDAAERTETKGEDKTPERAKERFRRREIEELMGVHSPTYKRGAGGVIRRKR